MSDITPGSVMRQEFGGEQISVSAQTSDTAVAAHTQAQVQARYIMALRRPRSWTDVRARILAECRRPGFAASAMYKKPKAGQTIEGLSIRFAEAAARCMTNVHQETTTIYDDRKKRIVRVQVTDLESNLTYGTDLTIEKTTERSKIREGQQVIGTRVNSYGKPVYLVEATEDDLQNKEGSATSKALRNAVLRLLPGDIQDEAKETIQSAGMRDAMADPQAALKKLCDGFMALNVAPSQLTEFLGYPIEQINPRDVVELRGLYTSIKQGDMTFRDALDAKLPDAKEGGEGEDTKPSTKRQALKDKVKRQAAAPRKEAKPAEAPPAPEPEPEPEVGEREVPTTDDERARQQQIFRDLRAAVDEGEGE